MKMVLIDRSIFNTGDSKVTKPDNSQGKGNAKGDGKGVLHDGPVEQALEAMLDQEAGGGAIDQVPAPTLVS